MDLDASHGRAAALPIDERVEQGRHSPHDAALQALDRIGFVRRRDLPRGGQGWSWRGDAGADRRLLQLLSRFDLRLEAGSALDGVAWIALAIPASGQAASAQTERGELFAGAGFTPADAVRACLGECAEFQSWLFRADDAGTQTRRGAPGDRALDPWTILGFAPEQIAGRDVFNDAWRGYDSVPAAATFGGEISWSAVESLADGSTHWLPTQLCYGRYPASTWRNDSSGCAAGSSAEQALASAMHELIERDATGIWWYGQCARPALEPAALGLEHLSAAIGARAARGQRVHLLDLTHDLGVPVAAAVLLDAGDGLQGLGFGCKADEGDAAASAYLEMCQMELSIEMVRQRVERAGDAASADDRRLLAWMETADLHRFPHLSPAANAKPAARHADQGSAALIARLTAAGHPIYRLNLERPAIGIPAVRVFAPGLCHFKPRLGHARLVEVPKRLGWRSADFSAKDLSPVPLLI